MPTNLCFREKIRKNVYPCKPQFYYIKVGCNGVFVTRTCFRDGKERDLIFPQQTEEKAVCILVLGCPRVEHDQIFPIQFEEVGTMFDLDCPFIQSRVSILFCIQQKFNEN